MRRAAALLASLTIALTTGACASEPDAARTGQSPEAETVEASPDAPDAPGTLPDSVVDLLEGYDDVAGLDVREAIVALDQLPESRPLAVQASVRADEVIFSDGTQEVAVPIPGDEVYVSIAPYREQTHDCYYHALGGCQGELVGESLQVTIADEAGEVLVEEEATTYTNGFVGFWLPKDMTGTITVTDAEGELSGQAPFDTGADGPTCITTLQLG